MALLKNWERMVLLCTDYELILKVLPGRLKNTLDLLIHRDQPHFLLGSLLFGEGVWWAELSREGPKGKQTGMSCLWYIFIGY